MQTSRLLTKSFKRFAFVAALIAGPVYADQLVYVPLTQPCRLLDTRISTGGLGPLTAAHGAYLFGTSDADIESAQQHGSAAGCGIPSSATAVSVNMNMLNASAAGNIATWTADAGSAPNIGTAVYNPSAANPVAGQVLYNTGYTTIPLGSDIAGKFHLQVANGEIDMTINLVGYWLSVSWSEMRNAIHAIAFGDHTTASGNNSTAMGIYTMAGGGASTAMGYNTIASNTDSTAMGQSTTASGFISTAMGSGTTASGDVSTTLGQNSVATGSASTAMGQSSVATGNASVAMGDHTTASGHKSTAMGYQTIADGTQSTSMGTNVGAGGHFGSFIYGDASDHEFITNTANNQFLVVASGGVTLMTSPTGATGAVLPAGNSSWVVLSDRNAKTAVRPIDSRDVLKKVAALPLNTWQYKSQDSKYRHMGPMAQDFYAAFHLGESDKGIDTVDADGVALAAIQGLRAVLNDKEAEIAALHAETSELAKNKDAQIAALRAEKDREITALKKRVVSLETATGDLAEMKAQLAALRSTAAAPITVALRP